MLKAVIIDNEPLAVFALKLIIKDYCKNAVVVGTSNSPVEGIELIAETKPDVVFLDVDMPEMTGFEMLEKIEKRDFDVVFVTAHDDYAIKAFRCSAIDYIQKPLKIDEVIDALDKIEGFRNKNIVCSYYELIENFKSEKPTKLVLHSFNGHQSLFLDEILYIKANGSYTEFTTKLGGMILVSKHLKEYHDLLTDNNFFRPHRSFIINIKNIDFNAYSKEADSIKMVDGFEVPLSRRKKVDFIALVDEMINEGIISN